MEVGLSLGHKHPGSTEEIPPFNINQIKPPKLFPNFVDDDSSNLIIGRFKIDLLWSITGGSSDNVNESEGIPLLGSWTHLNKIISEKEFQKAVIQYMPTVPQPVSDYSVHKAYLDFLLVTSETEYIFAL